jgi:hypothetical protein
MAYLKPPVFTKKVFNPVAMRLGLSGTEPLAVRSRKTGDVQRIPVIPVDHDGDRYVVSTRGESDWVRNCRAAGRVELGGDPYRIEELPLAEREPVIAAYRDKAGKAVAGYWKKLPEPGDHPVFRLHRDVS